MNNHFLNIFFLLITALSFSQVDKITVINSVEGNRLVVNGENFIIKGMNWDYVPIGTTITDSGIWSKSDEIIKLAIDGEMPLLKNMGVNVIRTYNIKPKWITYIYENYGIYTMLNITFGAYGLTINDNWVPKTNYANSETRKVLMEEARTTATTYKSTSGLLMYMIGNENNYHLSWNGAETQDIPQDTTDTAIRVAARALYKALNDATKEIKKIDRSYPIAICNGDLLYLDLIKEECKDVDIYGTNMYRGISFGDAFQRVKDELNMPILISEFGADAYNAKEGKEDQYNQAFYNVGNWKDIYQNVAGLGISNNSIGGFTFQFSDGWWKYKQTENLDVHDKNASWSNEGYSSDQAQKGDKNMNEEWFGICAKGPTNKSGLYKLHPRVAYYALKEVHEFNPYAVGIKIETLDSHFDKIQLALLKAKEDKKTLESKSGGKKRSK